MDWKDLSKTIGAVAPALGTAIGGPAGTALGALVAAALGSKNDPDSISQAVANNPDAVVKLKELETTQAVELQRLVVTAEQNRLAAETAAIQAEAAQDTATVQAVNTSIQAEAHSEHWAQYMWRPVWGFVSAGAFLFVCLLVCYCLYLGVVQHDRETMRSVPEVISAFVELFAIPGAILGISAWGRNKLKLARAQGSGTSDAGSQ